MKREVFFIIFNPVNYLMLAHENQVLEGFYSVCVLSIKERVCV
jgi:hypothetical protein